MATGTSPNDRDTKFLVFLALLRGNSPHCPLNRLNPSLELSAVGERHAAGPAIPMVRADKSIPLTTGPILRLYIAGNSPSSTQAEQNLKHLRTLMKSDAARVEVVDVIANPELAEEESVLATPTLCYERSGRRRRIIGDLRNSKAILAFFGIEMKGDAA